MERMKAFGVLLLVGTFLCLACSSVMGQPSSDQPASILVYPYFNSMNAHVTLLTVTNTNSDVGLGYANQVKGAVRIHFYYVNLIGGDGTVNDIDDDTCEVTNRWRTLTPNDTFTALAAEHNPEGAVGWVYVVAKDPQTGKAIDFDYLIGDILVANPATNFVWSVPAYGFEALSFNESASYPVTKSAGGHLFTDKEANGGVADGQPTFTGVIPPDIREYAAWPDELLLSSFVEQVDGIESFLVLLSGLDSDWRVKLKMLYYNDSEVEISQTDKFRCWIRRPLTYFMPGADNLPQGEGIFGMDVLQTGWARIDGDEAVNTASGGPKVTNAPILGMIIHTIGGQGSSYQAAHLLHHTGILKNTTWDKTIHGGLSDE